MMIYNKTSDFIFPVEMITTTLEWEDLIVNKNTYEIIIRIRKKLTLRKELALSHTLSPKEQIGTRALFFGPKGTGKTLTATLLGKDTGHEVYRVDVSLILSKYIGETEKNLALLFDKAEEKNWILFFDEADALFGKRTDIRDSHDKYANQEISYLLQRIDSFTGTVILAFKKRLNPDLLFFRRFSEIAEFYKPDEGQRFELWKKYLPKIAFMENEEEFHKISHKYELTGGKIVDAIRYAGAGRENGISMKKLMAAIRRETAIEDY